MKKKRWIVFRVAVYISMAMALLLIAVLFFFFAQSGNISTGDLEALFLFLLVPVALAIFQQLNIRLIHNCLPNNSVPGNLLRTWHTVLLVVSIICIILLSYLFKVAISDFINYGGYQTRKSFNREQYLVLGALVFIVVFNLYTIIASLQLRSYLRFNQKATEEALLNSIGKEETDA